MGIEKAAIIFQMRISVGLNSGHGGIVAESKGRDN